MTFHYSKQGGKWKYVLEETYQISTSCFPATVIITPHYMLGTEGTLTLHAGFAWNGADYFPDTESIMRGSCVHDALCQMINNGRLAYRPNRAKADLLLYDCCKEDGMSSSLAHVIFAAVRMYAEIKY